VIAFILVIGLILAYLVGKYAQVVRGRV
jgi:hypothetical protein